jgi:hypothetical protein
MANLLAPMGCIIMSTGDPTSVADDLPPTIETKVVFPLLACDVAPNRIRLATSRLRKLEEWRKFFKCLADAEPHNKETSPRS